MTINLNSLDKSSWETHRFDEIASSISERIEPAESKIDRYIGLEHLDAESIHIKRFGTKTDVKGQKLKCYPGDIIFGKRRAYQRKAALVAEEAICSAHSFVLRANPNVIDPSLFPFFLHSDQFMDRAIDISVGGLSPTINWKTLREQEFLLPPKAQQAKLAELLWAMDEVIEKNVAQQISTKLLKNVSLKEAFSRDTCEKVRICEISENLDNRRIPIKSSDRVVGPYPYFGASGIVDHVEGFLFDEPILLIAEDGENINSRKLPIAISVDEKCWVNNHAHVLRMTSASRYLVKEYLNFADISDFITGGTRPKITKGILSDMPVYLPKGALLVQAENNLKLIDMAISRLGKAVESSKALQKSLVNQVFL